MSLLVPTPKVGSLFKGATLSGRVTTHIPVIGMRVPNLLTKKSLMEQLATKMEQTGKIWTRTKKRNHVKNAFEHWNDHRLDFPGLQNAKQYVEATMNFLRKPPPGTLFKRRTNGDVVLYNSSKNIFSIRTQQGLPRTMYKPSTIVNKKPSNLDYFYAQ